MTLCTRPIISSLQYHNNVSAAADYVSSRLGTAQVAIVLGSGLSGFAAHFIESKELSYADIPSMPRTTVSGHSGKLIIGSLPSSAHKPLHVLCFAGRVHSYEGYTNDHINFLCRIAAAIGCKLCILTNSAGGALADMKPGNAMMIVDHLRMTLMDPLREMSVDKRFVSPDFSPQKIYSKKLADMTRIAAKDLGIKVCEGVYCWSPGPTYETPSEVQAGIRMGAGAFGMSTVPEVLASAAVGMEVFAMSLCTNMAAGLVKEKLLHDDVKKVALQAGPNFEKLLLHVLFHLDESSLESSAVTTLHSPPDEIVLRTTPKTISMKCSLTPTLSFWSSPSNIETDAKIIQKANDGCDTPTHAIFMGSNSFKTQIKKCHTIRSLSLSDMMSFADMRSSLSARQGSLVIGTDVNGIRTIYVERLYVDGFSCVESDLLVRVFAYLGVMNLMQIIPVFECSDDQTHTETEPTYISDIVCLSAVSIHPQASTLSDISQLHSPPKSKTISIIVFAGPTPPSSAERVLVNRIGCHAFAVTSVAPAFTALAAGLHTTIMVEKNDCVFKHISHTKIINNHASTEWQALRVLTYRQENRSHVEIAAAFCREKMIKVATKAVVIDAGLEYIVNQISSGITICSSDIPHWPDASTTSGSRWRIKLATFEDESVFYVFADTTNIVHTSVLYDLEFAMRLLHVLGVQSCVFANQVISTDSSYIGEGSVVSIHDHINMSGKNPLFGVNDDSWGTRFPDMNEAYISINDLPSCIVLYTGPTTIASPANARLANMIGANVLCSGLVPLVIIARHMQMNVAALAVVGQCCSESTSTSTKTSTVTEQTLTKLQFWLEKVLTSL